MNGQDINERMAELAPSQNIGASEQPPATDPMAQVQRATMPFDLADVMMKTSLMSARTVDPDQAAKARRAGSQIGVGTDIALRNPDEVQRRAYMDGVSRMEIAQRDPRLAEFLRDRDNAMLAQDDLENLRETKSLWETAVDYRDDLFKRGLVGLASGMIDFERATYAYSLRGREIQDWERSKLRGMGQLSETIYQMQSGGLVGASARMAGQQIEPMIQAGERGLTGASVFGLTAAAAAPFTAGGSLAAVKPAAILGWSAGFTSSLVESAYIQLAGESYADLIENDVPPDTAYYVSGVAGAINAGIEIGSLGLLTKPFRQAVSRAIMREVSDKVVPMTAGRVIRTASKEYGQAMLIEVGEEELQLIVNTVGLSVSQGIERFRTGGKSPEVALLTAQGWQELLDKAVKTGVETAKAMVILGAAGPFAKGMVTTFQMDAAMDSGRKIKRAMELAAKSKLRERDASAYQSLLEQRSEGTPGESVYIDANTMQSLMRAADVTASDMDAAVAGFSDRMAEASATNAPIRLSTAEFLAQLSTTDIGKAMAPHLRVGDPSAMTMFDAARGESMREAMIAQSNAAIEARSQTDKAFAESANKVEDEIAQMLRDTGKFSPEQVAAQSELAVAFVVTQAARANLMPEAYWQRFRSPIAGPGTPAAPAAMEQADVTVTPQGIATPQYRRAWHKAETGTPITVTAWHAPGGSEAAQLTDTARQQMGRDTTLGAGWYGARDKDISQTYGEPDQFEVTLTNPFVFSDPSSRFVLRITNEELQRIRDAGHDGIVVKGVNATLQGQDRSHLQVVAFNPEQSVRRVAPRTLKQASRMDADYLAAVERGDMDTAQMMVDEAASAAGVMFRGHKLGRPLGSTETFVAQSREQAQQFANQHRVDGTVSLVRFTKPLRVYEQPIPWQEYQDSWRNSVLLKGYDAVRIIEPNGQGVSLAIRNPSAIAFESADPVTYDESGAVVPLSRRFNLKSPKVFEQQQFSFELPPDAGVFDADNPPAPAGENTAVVAVMTSDGRVIYDRSARMHGDRSEERRVGKECRL